MKIVDLRYTEQARVLMPEKSQQAYAGLQRADKKMNDL
jgi:hypothetical protein